MRWGWVVTLPLTVIVVIFAVMNRATVHVELWPWPWDAETPLFILVGATFLVGFLAGALAMWFSGKSGRRRFREIRQANARNAKELNSLKANVPHAAESHQGPARLGGPASGAI